MYFASCAGGVSRSSAVVVAYIMRKERISLAAALSYVRERHPAAAPNSGFIHQLMEWEKRIGVNNAPLPSPHDLDAAGNRCVVHLSQQRSVTVATRPGCRGKYVWIVSLACERHAHEARARAHTHINIHCREQISMHTREHTCVHTDPGRVMWGDSKLIRALRPFEALIGWEVTQDLCILITGLTCSSSPDTSQADDSASEDTGISVKRRQIVHADKYSWVDYAAGMCVFVCTLTVNAVWCFASGREWDDFVAGRRVRQCSAER